MRLPTPLRTMRRPRYALPAVAAAVAACSALVIVPANAGEAGGSADEAGQSAERPKRECEHWRLKEEMISWDTNMDPGTDVPAGFMAVWLDELYDWETGELVATATGNMDIIYETAEGHDIEYQYEIFHFPEGTFTSQSAFDRFDVVEGEFITQPVRGLSGKYEGWKGTWTWRIMEIPEDPNQAPPFETIIDICAPRR
ncbi:allene oxide cyclase barrel-like domain-containing protein [Streptomyces sp. 6N223]|uniref:allene oxide cyclase barrel-like domain-containing protein n=1 Tax=Streptomyces sp. 6N223 TaxID=3457412 RepID=UPI003FD4FA44